MALPTKNGRLRMKLQFAPKWLLSGLCALLLGACTHKPNKTLESGNVMAPPPPPPQSSLLLKEARLESEQLRTEVASLKILMAKQAGELRALREQTQSIQHRESDQGSQLQTIRGELLTAKAEQDRLRRRNTELEGQVSSMPKTEQLLATIQGLRDSFQQVMTNMKSLASDIKLIKKEMNLSSKKAAPKQITLRPSNKSGDNPERTPDAQGKIIIEYGDTLWGLARQYKISVQQLKEWNDLDSDFIMTGFRLQVVSPESLKEKPPAKAELITKPSSSTPAKAPIQAAQSAQTTLQKKSDVNVENEQGTPPVEPKHILSIGNPQTDTHETP